MRKTQASAFFGTGLRPWLTRHRVDTLVIAGCATIGGVRATAVDALRYNYRLIVPRDCVGDRACGPHEANLFDLEQKYAGILSTALASGTKQLSSLMTVAWSWP